MDMHDCKWNQDEFCRAELSPQIQLNIAELIEWFFTVQMDNDLKHTAKAKYGFLKAKK